MLNGLGLKLCLEVSLLLLELQLIKCSTLSLVGCCVQSCESSSVKSVPPTTSIGSSSLSSLSELSNCPRCCAIYSDLKASISTVIPFALSFRACLSIAFAIFFLLLALHA